MEIIGYFDGCCGPVNPGGTASYGFVIYGDGVVQRTGRGVVGTGEGMTNNVAEAVGLHRLLRCILDDFSNARRVTIRGDSEILIRQLNGQGRRRPQGHYARYLPAVHRLGTTLRARCPDVRFEWIPREHNVEADALANQALDDPIAPNSVASPAPVEEQLGQGRLW